MHSSYIHSMRNTLHVGSWSLALILEQASYIQAHCNLHGDYMNIWVCLQGTPACTAWNFSSFYATKTKKHISHNLMRQLKQMSREASQKQKLHEVKLSQQNQQNALQESVAMHCHCRCGPHGQLLLAIYSLYHTCIQLKTYKLNHAGPLRDSFLEIENGCFFLRTYISQWTNL